MSKLLFTQLLAGLTVTYMIERATGCSQKDKIKTLLAKARALGVSSKCLFRCDLRSHELAYNYYSI